MERESSRRSPVAEAFESRRLLSASVVDGTLLIVGTSAGDAIVVYASPPHAVMSPTVTTARVPRTGRITSALPR